MATTVQSSAQFSMTLDIAGNTIPLKSGDITSIPAATSGLKSLLDSGITFSTPADFRLALPLANFTDWLTKNNISLPKDLDKLFSATTITIFHASASTNGSFSFSFAVAFNPPLGSGTLGGFIDLENIGISISHTVKPQPSS